MGFENAREYEAHKRDCIEAGYLTEVGPSPPA